SAHVLYLLDLLVTNTGYIEHERSSGIAQRNDHHLHRRWFRGRKAKSQQLSWLLFCSLFVDLSVH
ncbi:hypothetical protein, partial [Vibrio diazotrophicus]|uniref:hypothetical protein n=1 Tax=Vibrio diazotrophicus TaxID=685 RepID=UPI0039EB9158